MKPISVVSTVASAIYAVVLSTGLLTTTLCVIAAFHSTSFVEYYEDVFPRSRGGVWPIHMSAWGYAAYVTYIVVATMIAVQTRKRIAAQ